MRREDIELQHFLHYFKNEDQASDVSEGGVIDLGDVDEIKKEEGGKGISIVTESLRSARPLLMTFMFLGIPPLLAVNRPISRAQL